MSRPRWLFTFLLPTLWATICLANFRHPGDEYGLWGGAALPGLWLPVLVGAGNMSVILMLTLAGGVPPMAALGAIFDRLRVPWVPWYACWLVGGGLLCAAQIASYPSWARAMSKNGSFQAYALSSLNVSLTVSVLVAIAVMGVYRVIQRVTLPRGSKGGSA